MGLFCCYYQELLYLITALAGLFVWRVFNKVRFLSRLPPGPWGLPVVGQLIHLNRANALEEFQKWRKTYGDTFSYSIGDFNVTVFHDFKTIMDVLKRDEFQARPDFQSWEARNGVKNRGILFTDGVHSWSEQRRFALRTLRDFGFGKESMEGLLQSEMELLVRKFMKDIAKGEALDLTSSFSASTFNSLWYIVSGVRFDLDDPEFHKILKNIQGHLREVKLTSPGAFYPWPAKNNLIRRGLWERMISIYRDLEKIADELLEKHKESYDENQTRDFVDAFLHQTEEKKLDASSSFNESSFRDTWRVVMIDLFSAGTETSSTTLLWAILYMTKFPEIQKKLQEEVDRVIGKRLPTRSDKANMPYVEAFTNETHRKASLLPMSVYHATMKDVEYNGHFLPKGMVVFPNLHAVHHDKSYWGDPEVFRPERFLDSTGTNLVKHEYLIPFSAGKRQCLGETLARDTLFIFLTGLIQNFTFELDDSSKDIDPFKLKPLFVVSPDPYKVIMRHRVEQ